MQIVAVINPSPQFWTQQYKRWRLAWCFLSLPHNLKSLKKFKRKARTPFFLTHKWVAFAFSLCLVRRNCKDSRQCTGTGCRLWSQRTVTPVREPWGVLSQSLPKVTNSLLSFCKYQEEVNMKKERKKKKSHQHSKRMLMRRNRLELGREKF